MAAAAEAEEAKRKEEVQAAAKAASEAAEAEAAAAAEAATAAAAKATVAAAEAGGAGGDADGPQYSDDEEGVRAWLTANKLAPIADVLINTGADTMTDVLDITEDDKEDLVAEGLKPLKFKALLKAIIKSKTG